MVVGMKSVLQALLLLMICGALMQACGTARAASDYIVQGTVTDRDGKPVPLATVTLYFNGTIVSLLGNPTYSDFDGIYQFRHVPPGLYGIEARRNDFSTSFTISVKSSNLTQDFRLSGNTSAMAATPTPAPTIAPTPVPTMEPTATPAPVTATPRPAPTATLKKTPGFGMLAVLAGAGIALAAKRNN